MNSIGQDYWPLRDRYDLLSFAAPICDAFASTACQGVSAGARAGRARALSHEASACSADGSTGAAPSPSGAADRAPNVPRFSPTPCRTGSFDQHSARGDGSPGNRTRSVGRGRTRGKDGEARADEDLQEVETITHAIQVRFRCSHDPQHANRRASALKHPPTPGSRGRTRGKDGEARADENEQAFETTAHARQVRP